MDRRRRLSCGGRHLVHACGRMWPWLVSTTDPPRRRLVRPRRNVPHRGGANFDRAGATSTLFRRRDRRRPDPDGETERISAGILLADDSDGRDPRYSVPLGLTMARRRATTDRPSRHRPAPFTLLTRAGGRSDIMSTYQQKHDSDRGRSAETDQEHPQRRSAGSNFLGTDVPCRTRGALCVGGAEYLDAR
jgi:hypothetical protein